MLVRFIGWIFGFTAEIAQLTEKVRQLGWDDSFGMYTRPAFLDLCKMQPRGRRIIAFLDFDRVHELNRELGYEEVNRRIRQLFSGRLRRSDLVGRHFSGDEIVILLDTTVLRIAEEILEGLQAKAAELGLSFTSALGSWDGQEPLQEVISALGEEVMERKERRHRAA